jgi:hypothetical protein
MLSRSVPGINKPDIIDYGNIEEDFNDYQYTLNDTSPIVPATQPVEIFIDETQSKVLPNSFAEGIGFPADYI